MKEYDSYLCPSTVQKGNGPQIWAEFGKLGNVVSNLWTKGISDQKQWLSQGEKNH